jgi:hypothetical protein
MSQQLSARFKVKLPVPPLMIPLLAALILVAFLVTGFKLFLPSDRTNNLLSLPIYGSVGVLLLIMQVQISSKRSLWHMLYLLATAGAALVFVGYFLVTAQNAQITRDAALYEIGEAVAAGIFILDAARRRWKVHQATLATKQRDTKAPPSFSQVATFFGDLAADVAGLSIIFYMTWGFLGVLTSPTFAQILLICSPTQPTCTYVDTSAPGFLSAQATSPGLNAINLNIILAVATTVMALILLGMAALLAITHSTQDAATGRGGEMQFLRALREILVNALYHVYISLRLVLNPVIWLVPAIIIAVFAYTTESALIAPISSQCQQQNLFLALFSPVGPCSTLAIYGIDFAEAAAIVLAFGVVIGTVALAERNFATIKRTREVLVVFGRRLVLALVFFIYAAGAINAVVVLVARIMNGTPPNRLAAPIPFHVGATGIIALVVSAIELTVVALRNRFHLKMPDESGDH